MPDQKLTSYVIEPKPVLYEVEFPGPSGIGPTLGHQAAVDRVYLPDLAPDDPEQEALRVRSEQPS